MLTNYPRKYKQTGQVGFVFGSIQYKIDQQAHKNKVRFATVAPPTERPATLRITPTANCALPSGHNIAPHKSACNMINLVYTRQVVIQELEPRVAHLKFSE